MSSPVIFDGRGLPQSAKMIDLGFRYEAVGSPARRRWAVPASAAGRMGRRVTSQPGDHDGSIA